MLNRYEHFLYNTDKVYESYLKNNSVGDVLSSHDIDYMTQCSSKLKSSVKTYCHVLLETNLGQIEGLMIIKKKNNKFDMLPFFILTVLNISITVTVSYLAEFI
jgi:hypothetical protein